MNNLYTYKKSESLKKTNKILNKTKAQKLLEVLSSTLLLILAYDALLFGSDYLLQYYQSGEITNTLLINKPFFNIVIPAMIGAFNTNRKLKKDIRKEFNATINLHVIKNQIENNTDVYYLDEEAIKNAKSVKVEIKDEKNSKKNISLYAIDPYNTVYIEGLKIISNDIDKITSYKNEDKFIYLQEERKKTLNDNQTEIKYYEIKSLDNNLKNTILEQTNNESINQVFTEKNARRKIRIKTKN